MKLLKEFRVIGRIMDVGVRVFEEGRVGVSVKFNNADTGDEAVDLQLQLPTKEAAIVLRYVDVLIERLDKMREAFEAIEPDDSLAGFARSLKRPEDLPS